MSDDFSLDIGPLPEAPQTTTQNEIVDAFDHQVGFNFAFIGVGQAGGRIARTFNDLGYSRVCAVNTADADLAELDKLPGTAKLSIGDQQGAGKDPATAKRMFAGKDEEIFDLMKRSWGTKVDYAFVCLSGAGGTGAGAYATVAKVAKQYMRDNKRPAKVGCVMALPKDAEGPRAATNLMQSIQDLTAANLSPIIFIDNERFTELYGNQVAASQEKPQSNASTAKLLHTFNRLAGTESEDVGGSTFDPTDFSRILDSGVVAFAATSVTDWSDPTKLTGPIREQLQKNVLASLDLSQGTVAGLLYVLMGPAWDGTHAVTSGTLDHGTQMMNRMLRGDAAVFTGVYPAKGNQGMIQILAMVGGLPYPMERLEALAERAGLPKDSIAASLGI